MENPTTFQPMISTEEPIMTTFQPMISTEEPIMTTEEPIMTTEEPIMTTEAPSLEKFFVGYIYDEDKKPLENVVVTNLSKNIQILSDEKGFYEILGEFGDDFLFTKNGYKSVTKDNVRFSKNIVVMKKTIFSYHFWIFFIFILFGSIVTGIIDDKRSILKQNKKKWQIWILFCVLFWLSSPFSSFFPIGTIISVVLFLIFTFYSVDIYKNKTSYQIMNPQNELV